MKKSRFREEQMVTILREADRRPVPEVAKQHGVSAQTIYSWRKHFGTLEPADVKRLRQLEQENGRLKKMVADRDLEIDVLKEITRKKWWAHVCAGSRSRMRADAGCRAAGRAPGAPDECPTDLWVANYYSARNPLRLSSLVILGVVARMFRCATRSSCWCT